MSLFWLLWKDLYMPQKLGKLIERIAKEKGLSQSALGKMINRSKQTVGNIYTRQSIDYELLIAISEALETDFFKFLYEMNDSLKSFKAIEMAEVLEKINTLETENLEKDRIIEQLNEKLRDKEENFRVNALYNKSLEDRVQEQKNINETLTNYIADLKREKK